MNNLVIGSSGFIGKSLCEYLEKNGETVFPLDIKNHRLDDARYITLPLSYIDRVYFLAWDVGGAKYLYDQNNQLTQLEWNIQLLMNIIPQLQYKRTKFIFVSSQLSDNPDSVYGVTKKLGEIWTNLVGGIIIRLWNIYGPYEDATVRSHVIGDFIHQALSNGHINMMTNGKERRQFIHIDDLTFIMKDLMDRNNNGMFDITTQKWISVYKIAKIISKITGCTILRGSNRGAETMVDPKHLPQNWTPQIQIYEGLERTINEYRNSCTTSGIITN
jgi:nucleoside-diphosphate-sugar epimerase